MTALPQLASRAQLAGLFHGQCAELGVAAGAFSREIITRGNCDMLWSIDRWSDHHGFAEYKRAAELLAYAGCAVLRMTFDEALPLFEDGSLDCITIDAYAHTGEEDGKILRDWWPKLKSGGLFCGHDYDPAWPLVIKAVDEFAAAKGFEFQVTNGADSYQSWYGIKP